MNQALNDKRVAILATDGFEESELSSPRDALKQAGAEVHVVTPKGDDIRAWAKPIGAIPTSQIKPWPMSTRPIITHWWCPAVCSIPMSCEPMRTP